MILVIQKQFVKFYHTDCKKIYIYNCRCKEIKPCFEVALLEIKKYYKIEQQLSNFNARYVDRWHIISEKINVL